MEEDEEDVDVDDNFVGEEETEGPSESFGGKLLVGVVVITTGPKREARVAAAVSK